MKSVCGIALRLWLSWFYFLFFCVLAVCAKAVVTPDLVCAGFNEYDSIGVRRQYHARAITLPFDHATQGRRAASQSGRVQQEQAQAAGFAKPQRERQGRRAMREHDGKNYAAKQASGNPEGRG